MKKVIIIRYSEIHLKGNNRGFFENALLTNIKKSLSDLKCELLRQQGRYLIVDFNECDECAIIDRLKKVFGIHSISPAMETDSDTDEIFECVKALAQTRGRFRINTNRADKAFPLKSMEMSAEMGGRLLQFNPALKVDLHKPDWCVNIDIRENGKTLVYAENIRGVNGMPVGTSGKGLLLLSGGIDSPVAGYMMAKRGLIVDCIHYVSPPYTSERARMKVEALCEKLTDWCGDIIFYCVPFTELQEALRDNCPEELFTVLMRRLMVKIANRVCAENDYGAIITGESVAQVASQTLPAIFCTNAAAEYPVFRPVIGMDKREIVDISRHIDTFDISTLPYEDCCTVFSPKHPKTRPTMEDIVKAEESFDFEPLIEKAVRETEVKRFRYGQRTVDLDM